MNRRDFMSSTTGMLLASHQLGAAPDRIPIIDTHIHLYDPSRPQGVPWPPKTDKLIYKPTLPSRFREVTAGLGIAGALEVECSPWLDDNQWVLDVAAKDTIIVGMVGNLEPEKPGFRTHLERYSKNPLYCGIRYGYLWDRNPRQALQNPEFIRGLKDLASAGLSLDTANPSVELLEDVLRMSDSVPNLRIVLDHLPALYPPSAAPALARYKQLLQDLQSRKLVYAKLSAILRMQDGKKVPYRLQDHKDRLDLLYQTFGSDRVFYGSDWPNSDPSAPYAASLAVMQEYFSSKPREAAEKYFWRNSVHAYRWKPRSSDQPTLASDRKGD
ncbi:MAG TPA: amidohydrolase family protein [Bryobacteraceae bacterium]|nr:amidohydrolase family protein [Bryobacteraceae bacterium]